MAEPEFTTHRVTATCRDCGDEFETLAFFDTPAKRYGLCETCAWADKRKQEARERKVEPPAKDTDLSPPRRIWEPD